MDAKKANLTPAERYPQLIDLLVEAILLTRKLMKLLIAANVAEKLGITKQAIEYHVDKKEKL